ncbi:MAG: glycosyltransferase [Deltaproteobacteria bacterium]|nr:glycosyltransferase [Deltaproteobacteria bacterium]MCL5791441.1 glycosyltransferase [Deltaproteobacteria bacterium]
MISIVCVYNNQDILKNILLKSLKTQTTKFELITIDNTNHKYESAAQALNFGGENSNNKYIMFVHQDVELHSNSWLQDAETYLDSIQNLGIAGVAGISEKGNTDNERARNIIRHGPDYHVWGNSINSPEPVQTLDECLTIIPQTVFQKLKFDEGVCIDWHLYAVDYCLTVKRMNLAVYVLPMYIYHKSLGFSSSEYYQTVINILEKHKDHIQSIYASGGSWSTAIDITKQLCDRLEEKNNLINAITAELQRREEMYTYSGLFWKFRNTYNKFIHKAFPYSSRKRKIYSFLHESLKSNPLKVNKE